MSYSQQILCRRIKKKYCLPFKKPTTTFEIDFKLDTVEELVHMQTKKLYTSLNDHSNSPVSKLGRYHSNNPYYRKSKF